MTHTIPDRGDVVWLIFTPQAGREQAGHRPALVLSPAAYNQRVGLGLFCPITSQRKGYPFEVPIPANFPVAGVILADQIKSLDWRIRQAEYRCTLPDATIAEVLRKVGTLLL
ncbi:MAG: endoribonuclease MazF [Roseiflexaceae bacterium]|nr:endoribonuclease MazF [Roseiflexaceae bacterium]